MSDLDNPVSYSVTHVAAILSERNTYFLSFNKALHLPGAVLQMNAFIITSPPTVKPKSQMQAILIRCVWKHSYTPQFKDANVEKKMNGVKMTLFRQTKSNPKVPNLQVGGTSQAEGPT